MMELIVVILILGVLLAIALPNLLGYQDPARDVQAKSVVYEVHRAARSIWQEDGQQYTSTADLLTKLTPGEPAFTYRADLPQTSYSINPTDASIKVEDPRTVTVCSRSVTDTVFCARFAELANLMVAAADPSFDLVASLGLAAASAASGKFVDSPDPSPSVAYSRGVGPDAEADALAALPTSSVPSTCNAGPGNTGIPSWDTQADCPEAPPPTLPPDVQITSGPSGSTSSQSATFVYSTALGGPVSSLACTLDGIAISCVGGTASASGLAYGAHTFAVLATGAGGSDSDSRAWTVTAPPLNTASFDGVGDYLTSVVPGSFPSSNNSFEVGAWVKMNGLPSSGQLATVVSFGLPGQTLLTNKPIGWQLSVNSAGMLSFSGYGSNGQARSVVGGQNPSCVASEGGSSAAIATGNWNYVAGYWSQHDGLRVYLNNKVQGCATNNLNPANTQTGLLYIGAQLTGVGSLGQLLGITPGAYLNGRISSLRLTNQGAPCYVVNPGPSTASPPPILYSPAENGLNATFLFSFQNTWADSMGFFGALNPFGDASLIAS